VENNTQVYTHVCQDLNYYGKLCTKYKYPDNWYTLNKKFWEKEELVLADISKHGASCVLKHWQFSMVDLKFSMKLYIFIFILYLKAVIILPFSRVMKSNCKSFGFKKSWCSLK